ncbi:TetR/AcrR family transcriptional regulator [Lapillicoccus jejuensis]|uniref:TetR family transcriptional regulator n=1 Tax=Lapillicoccus jejuensis TaxID=402171 RepID=A0A542DYZ9_9MICO|nr:TetR-like C-terminal domain-containing protein [Lapillicoccus jejuensis]TQJ08279.1 TetR family transcriptional regulator [Lapillicoccus jejuensis]
MPTTRAPSSTPAPSTRAERREEVTRRILEIGRDHLAKEGAAALSLRAVTRDLGMVSSAVYRYVANRDDLLTLLVVDAYTELADHVDAALARSRGGFAAQVLVLAGTMRSWAVAEPARWALLYGSPVPGYAAPPSTVEAGTRVMVVLMHLLDEGVAAGEVPTGAGAVALPRALGRDLAAVRTEVGLQQADDATLARGILLWTTLVGAVSLEVFGQLGESTFAHPDVLFEHQVRQALRVVTAP